MIGVIGATGHIGNTLTRLLKEKGKEVRAIVPKGEDLSPIEDLAVDIHFADIRDYSSIKDALYGCSKVFHLAGIVSIKSNDWKRLYEVNVLGTRNVIKACIENKVERLVYTSSIHAFKEPEKGIIIDESSSFEPQYGDYAKTKAMASKEVLEAVNSGLDAIIVCPTGVIGPYDFKISEMGTLILNYAKRKVVFYIDGEYDFVDVRDVAMGHMLTMEKGKKGEIYILSGEKITVRGILSLLKEATNENRVLVRIPTIIAKIATIFSPIISKITKEKEVLTQYSISVLNSNCNISSNKAKSTLGFSARPLRESIKDSYEWFRNKGYI